MLGWLVRQRQPAVGVPHPIFVHALAMNSRVISIMVNVISNDINDLAAAVILSLVRDIRMCRPGKLLGHV